MTTVYHNKQRTRASTWVPRRVFYVLRFLQRQLTAGKPQAISNKRIQESVRFGSEGEVSQIMRYLAGELPTMGRWAYGCLNANPQQYRFITRERMPSGGYLITLLPTPESIDAMPPQLPEIVQLSFFESDPSMIPQQAHQSAPKGGSFFHDPFDIGDPPRSKAPDRRSQWDQHEENLQNQTQEEESRAPESSIEFDPLYQRLMANPRTSRKLAAQIAKSPPGTTADFDADLRIAQTFARDPFFFTADKWRDGQRVIAPQEQTHERSVRAARSARTGPSAPQRQPDATRTTPPERGPVRTQLIY